MKEFSPLRVCLCVSVCQYVCVKLWKCVRICVSVCASVCVCIVVVITPTHAATRCSRNKLTRRALNVGTKKKNS